MFYLDQLCDIFSSKLPFIFAMTTSEEVSVPIMMEFYRFILGHLFHFVCHLDHFSMILTKFMFMLVISMLEIGSVPILRPFYDIMFFGHLCHISCHLDHFGNSIFKNHVHIHNQHV